MRSARTKSARALMSGARVAGRPFIDAVTERYRACSPSLAISLPHVIQTISKHHSEPVCIQCLCCVPEELGQDIMLRLVHNLERHIEE